MEQINLLLERYPCLISCKKTLEEVCEALFSSYSGGGKLLVCGNGGSCADSDHIVGELMKGFCKKRELSCDEQTKLVAVSDNLGAKLAAKLQGTLRAINLGAHSGFASAFCNDVDPDLVYAQQVWGYADKGDVFLGISTSGHSKNVIYAGAAAKALGAVAIGLTGEAVCEMDGLFDYVLHVPERETYRIQELHLPIYHAICLELESRFF